MKLPKLKIKVSIEDISRGRQNSLCNCPLALAIKRRFKKCTVRVYADSVELSPPYKKCDMFMHSKKSKDFTERFDSGLHVYPATFVLQ